MKKIILIAVTIVFFASCKPTFYVGDYGQVNQTQVVLSNSKFKVLGSFQGIATDKKKVLNIKDRQGLIARAKEDLLKNAKSAGVELKGSRALINVAVDIIDNIDRITVMISAEIVEFTD